MRKLITMFLTINVGVNWHKESIISSLLQITERNTSKDPYLNPLYDLDFIHLSSILFELRHDILDKLDKLLQKKDLKKEDIEEIRNLRKSTWDKYFAEKLTIKGEELKKKWEMLYKLRCAIAHNRYILREDYEKIKGICSEINKIMSNALDKINVISINENEKEAIKEVYKQNVESYIGTSNATLSKDRLDLLRKIVESQTKTSERYKVDASKGMQDRLRKMIENQTSPLAPKKNISKRIKKDNECE